MECFTFRDDNVILCCPGNDVTQCLGFFGHMGIVTKHITHLVLVYGTGEIH